MTERPTGETLVQFQNPIAAPDGRLFEARACGSPMDGEMWQGWIEFVPIGGGEPIRSPRETTQPNRIDTEYWATGLTEVYLEGALSRAFDLPLAAPVPPQPSVFRGPAPATIVTPAEPTSILDPFSVFEKGEPLLRRQLGALSAWHLVNIALDYELTDVDVETLNRMAAADLVELIVRGVREEVEHTHPA